MAHYIFEREQMINADLDAVWDFISRPENLSRITPDDMSFEITSDVPEKVYPGLIITYKVKPMPWYKTDWVTEITQVQDKAFFIDEQRIGPYKLWHHRHFIHEVPGGVLMKDIITYSPPGGWFGKLLNHLFIRKRIQAIFDFRAQAIKRLF